MNPQASTDTLRIEPGSRWAGAWTKAAIVGSAGLGLSAYGAMSEPTRFAHSYLFAFFVCLSIPVGALFFVLIQHLTRASWSVTVRRSSEFLMMGLPVFLVLALPVLYDAPRLYPWDGAPSQVEPAQGGAFANAADEGNREPAALATANRGIAEDIARARDEEQAKVLEHRRPFMNLPFFALRMLGYLALWSWIAQRFFRWSSDQDESKKPEITVAAQRFAPGAMVAFGVTLNFAAFDWLMSLEPTWYSTVFGVYVFAGCCVAHSAALILFARLLQQSGFLKTSISVEHYHDLGKLLFGWLSFWAYIAYVQFFLIWYANVPEELTFFHARWTDNLGSWKPVSASLFFLHFLVPFWLLLSRNMKRNLTALVLGAAVVLALHVVDIYWIVLPHTGVFTLHWLDATCLLGVGGVYAAAVLRAMQSRSLVPVGDPRLPRSLTFENS